MRRDSLNINEKREVHKGPGAIASGPNPNTSAGKAGLVSLLAKEKGGPGYWLHPATIRALPLQDRLAQDNAGALWWVDGDEVAQVTADKLDPSPSLVLGLTNQSDYTVEPHYSDPTIPLQPI